LPFRSFAAFFRFTAFVSAASDDIIRFGATFCSLKNPAHFSTNAAMSGAPNHAKVITDEFFVQVSGLIEKILAEMKKLRELGYSSPTLSLTLASIDRTADIQRQLYESMQK